MRAKCSIFLNDVVSLDVISVVLVEQAKVTAASWGPFDNYLITGHENGAVSQYDLRVSHQWCVSIDHYYVVEEFGMILREKICLHVLTL